MDIKQVIVIRKDLNMRKGKMVAQGAHASLKVFLDKGFKSDFSRNVKGDSAFSIYLTDAMEEWMNGLYKKIVVYVESKEELIELYNQANDLNIPTALIKDEGLTEFDKPTYTALAIGPDKSNDIDKITGTLPLL
ncbi:MAG: aminoacyl-tRNA hydrolase [Halanaerobiales bacterium]